MILVGSTIYKMFVEKVSQFVIFEVKNKDQGVDLNFEHKTV